MRRPPESVQVVALGLIQGAAELLPVSSSAHVAAVPWLLGWDVASWPAARRKELEVALHAGALVALAPELLRFAPDWRVLALALAPPVVAGALFERRIEERLGGPLGLAAGLTGGAVALAVADRGSSPRRGGQAHATQRGMSGQGLSPGALGFAGPEPGARRPGPVAAGLVLGAAQAAALVPGVSRTGATLAAARALGYSRPEASALSFGVAGPVLVGATTLKAWRIANRDAPASERRLAGVGAVAAFAGTRVALRVVGMERRAPLWPWAVERVALAGVILAVRYRRAR